MMALSQNRSYKMVQTVTDFIDVQFTNVFLFDAMSSQPGNAAPAADAPPPEAMVNEALTKIPLERRAGLSPQPRTARTFQHGVAIMSSQQGNAGPAAGAPPPEAFVNEALTKTPLKRQTGFLSLSPQPRRA